MVQYFALSLVEVIWLVSMYIGRKIFGSLIVGTLIRLHCCRSPGPWYLFISSISVSFARIYQKFIYYSFKIGWEFGRLISENNLIGCNNFNRFLAPFQLKLCNVGSLTRHQPKYVFLTWDNYSKTLIIHKNACFWPVNFRI